MIIGILYILGFVKKANFSYTYYYEKSIQYSLKEVVDLLGLNSVITFNTDDVGFDRNNNNNILVFKNFINNRDSILEYIYSDNVFFENGIDQDIGALDISFINVFKT